MKLYSHRILIILGVVLLAVAGMLSVQGWGSNTMPCIAKHRIDDNSRLPSVMMFSKKAGQDA